MKQRIDLFPLAAGLLLATATLATSCTRSSPGSADAADDAQPNVILALVDTLRADHLSTYGYERATSPALDALAAEGTVFERCLAASSWTLPSVAMLFTGQYRDKNATQLKDEDVDIASVFQAAGYQTAGLFSNPLLHPSNRKNFLRGFDMGVAYGAPKGLVGPAHGWRSDEMVERAERWFETVRDPAQPFFMYLHFYDPHHPYEPLDGLAFEPFQDPERRRAFRDALPEDKRELFNAKVYRELERQIALYDSEILQFDRGFARLLERLEEEELFDNTVIAVTSDHGEGLWERYRPVGEARDKALFFPELYQLHGATLYDDQVHVPLILRGPGVPRDERRTEFVSTIDIAPTLLGLAGIEQPAKFEGASLFDAALDRDMLFSLCSRSTSVTVDERWRLHIPADYRIEKYGAQAELFDLEVDPLELEPIDDAARQAELERSIDAFLTRVSTLEPAPEMSADERALLDQLGYTDQGREE